MVDVAIPRVVEPSGHRGRDLDPGRTRDVVIRLELHPPLQGVDGGGDGVAGHAFEGRGGPDDDIEDLEALRDAEVRDVHPLSLLRLAAQNGHAILGDHLPAQREGGIRQEIQAQPGAQPEAGRVDAEPVLVAQVEGGLHGLLWGQRVGPAVVVIGLQLVPAVDVGDADAEPVGVPDVPGVPRGGLPHGDADEPSPVGERDVPEVLGLPGSVGVDAGDAPRSAADALVPELQGEVAAVDGIELYRQRTGGVQIDARSVPVHVGLLVRDRWVDPAPDLSGELHGGGVLAPVVRLLSDLETTGWSLDLCVRSVSLRRRAVTEPGEERVGTPRRRRDHIQGGARHRRNDDVGFSEIEAMGCRGVAAGGQDRGDCEDRCGPKGEGGAHGLTARR